MHFRKKLGIWPNKGRGGLTEAQVFVKIFQNQICLLTVFMFLDPKEKTNNRLGTIPIAGLPVSLQLAVSY